MVNQIQSGLKAAKTKQAKASKAVITLSIDEQVKLAREAGAAKGAELSQREIFDKAAKALRDAKVTIGDARKCKVAQAFIEGRFEGKAVTAQTKKNALSAFRKAVETGKAYDENAARKAAKAAPKGASHNAKTDKAATDKAETKKAATHVEASETATTYQCAIARKGSAKKAAQTLRDLINKMKSSEEYAPLCNFLIDALDEFDGEE
jgi:hypothetical protein